MRLRHDKLKRIAEQNGATVETLGQAVERTGLEGVRAVSAVRNWMGGRDHPRCKAKDIARLAEALGVEPREIARFTSEVRFHRGSPRKARLLIDLVRDKPLDQALNMLAFSPKRAAVNVRKCLLAAYEDAQQAGADVDALYVSESRCDDAPRIKRFQPKDRGRAHPILKRLSHITISVQERDRRTAGAAR